MKYKKSYKGLIIWIILFFAIMVGIGFLPLSDSELYLRITTNVCTISISILTYIIYKTQNIYWYNGIDYNEALKISPEQRKLYALKHFKRFLTLSVIILMFSIIMHITSQNSWIDFVVGMLGLIITAISTIKIKLI